MKKAVAVFVLLAATAIWSVDIVPLQVKTGLWENTMTTTIGGQLTIPADKLAKLSPQQRARMEAALQARGGGNTHTSTYKSCITREDLLKSPFNDKQNCNETLISSTSTSAKIHYECMMEGAKVSGNIQFEAVSDVSVKGTGQGNAEFNGQPITTNSTFSGHWVQSSCGDVK